MKRVLRIEREGMEKDVGLRRLATVPAAVSVNGMVAQVQALIPSASGLVNYSGC